MAEEKKKTTTKKDEEVKVEKRFCTKCGKELKEDEVCDCESVSTTNSTTSASNDPMSKFFGEFVKTFKAVLKNPTATAKEEMKKGNLTSAAITLLFIVLSFGIFMMGFFKSAFVLVTRLFARMTIVLSGTDRELPAFSEIMDNYKNYSFPYMSQFLYGLLIFLLLAALVIVITMAAGKILKSKKFNFNKTLSLFAATFMPTIPAFLVMALLGIFGNGFMAVLALIIGLIVLLGCITNYLAIVIDELNVEGDKKVYTITGIIAVFVVILGFFTCLCGNSIGSSIVDGIEYKSSSDSDIDFD